MVATRARMPYGASFITNSVIVIISSAPTANSSTTASALRPRANKPTPTKSEKTMICSMLPVAAASMGLVGIQETMLSTKLKLCGSATAVDSSSPSTPLPGWRISASTVPTVTAHTDVTA